ncbi:MAG: NAD(P)/FAD-dependent oxidoreductase [Thermoleophilia bacterium]|nr:NAD(P)/FAD-dependent oxidoreductase [Thermoleophilia bacterium]
MSIHAFDAVVVGAGPAGEVLAGRLADGGLNVAIIEQHLVAGECSYYACMPSKALLRPGELLAEASRVPGASQAVTGEIAPEAVLERRDEVIHNLDDSSQIPWLEDKGISLFRGAGVLCGKREVRVGANVLIADRAVVVATGTGAAMPPIEGLDSVAAWNNREATTARSVPDSMVVLGGGPVGVELAQAWSSLGTKVTLVEYESRLVPREEPFASEFLADSLRNRHGVELALGARAERVSEKDGRITVTLGDGRTVAASELLVATGRRPQTGELGLESLGVEGGGFLNTDDTLRVEGFSWLFAVGDVNGRALLTHMGKYQAWVAAEQILGREARATSEALGSPRVTFTDPQIAAVGKTSSEAIEEGIDVQAVDVPTNSTAGASFTGKDVDGTCRFLIDRERRLLIGATFVGFETAEWVYAATLAIVAEVPVGTLRHVVPAFPTRSEIWLRLVEALEPAQN